jgi:deazaflavin-dependent oxidoreductase (nitroreductase family)
MTSTRRIPDRIWTWMRSLNRKIAASYGRIGPSTNLVLLLTTVGRKSGRTVITPLQYEEIDGVYYVGSARGARADWFQNLLAQPRVRVQVAAHSFEAEAEPILDPRRIADLFEVRLERHPRMIGLIMRAEGLPAHHSRTDLEAFAADKAAAALHPAHP